MISSNREEGKWVKQGIIQEKILELNLERTLDPQPGINNDQESREGLFTHSHSTNIYCDRDMSGTALGTENIKIKYTLIL